MVHAKIFQKTALSPPVWITGFKSTNKAPKSMVRPNANGIRPKTAEAAVSKTGVSLVEPASTMASFSPYPRLMSSSVNSISNIPFFHNYTSQCDDTYPRHDY